MLNFAVAFNQWEPNCKKIQYGQGKCKRNYYNKEKNDTTTENVTAIRTTAKAKRKNNCNSDSAVGKGNPFKGTGKRDINMVKAKQRQLQRLQESKTKGTGRDFCNCCGQPELGVWASLHIDLQQSEQWQQNVGCPTNIIDQKLLKKVAAEGIYLETRQECRGQEQKPPLDMKALNWNQCPHQPHIGSTSSRALYWSLAKFFPIKSTACLPGLRLSAHYAYINCGKCQMVYLCWTNCIQLLLDVEFSLPHHHTRNWTLDTSKAQDSGTLMQVYRKTKVVNFTLSFAAMSEVLSDDMKQLLHQALFSPETFCIKLFFCKLKVCAQWYIYSIYSTQLRSLFSWLGSGQYA